jgi:NTP pyrophosphatase (non-canonical NTP hydrolase)
MSFNMQHAEEFRHKFGVPTNRQQRSTQKTLIVEEVKEFLEAEQTMINGFTRNESECLKELADVVYVCFQFASVMDWDLDEALRRVHKSNLSKLDDEGKPVLRADGKVMKGPNYQPPDLSDLVCLK